MGSDLIYGRGWSMKDQIVLLQDNELKEEINMGKYINFKAGFMLRGNSIAGITPSEYSESVKTFKRILQTVEINH